jgi:hypothetical protein
MIKSMKMAVLVLIASCLLTAIPVQAQSNGCMSFRVLLQAKLNLLDKGWSGDVRGFLDNTIPLKGTFYGLPPAEPPKGTGQAAHEYGDRFVFDFGEKGLFVTEAGGGVSHFLPAVSPHMDYPPPIAYGNFVATAKVSPDPIVGTSGWFEKATGNISIVGPFLVDAAVIPIDMGVWNAEINGKLCNVTP